MHFYFKEIIFKKKKKIKLKFIESAGQEKYRSLPKSYFKNVDVVLFVFSMDDKDTFDRIKDWMELFKSNNNKKDEDVLKYLIGNKNDLEINVDQSLIDEFVQENKISFMSISAKAKNNINELFEEIGKKLYTDYLNKGNKGNKEHNVTNIKIIKQMPRNRCCISHPDM